MGSSQRHATFFIFAITEHQLPIECTVTFLDDSADVKFQYFALKLSIGSSS